MTSNDFNDFLMGGGTTTAKFPTPGASIRGRIVSAEVQDQKDIDGNIRTWNDGNVRKQLKVVLSTDLRDPDIADDRGDRAVYVKGQMLAAVREAIRAAGQHRMEVGGELAVRYERDEPSEKRGYNPTKIYRCQYKAPSVDAGDMFGHPAPTPAQAAPVQTQGPAADDLF